MNPQSPSGPRRWLAWLAPPFLLLVLVIVGRRAEVSDAAAAAVSPSALAGPATSHDASAGDASSGDAREGGANDAPTLEALRPDGSAESPRPTETLADGAVIVDLNLASEDELRKLPGIGPGRARKILELRARLGRLQSVDDLARIKGFGRTLLKRLRPLARTS